LAGISLSAAAKKFGAKNTNRANTSRKTQMPTLSLTV
jgi:hypothetical protein